MTKLPRSVLFILAAIVLIFAFETSSVTAQAPTPSDNQVNEVARQMYCPVCENIPLDVCPTTACAEWRELIRLKISEGWTTDEIKAYFAQQYGDRVLAKPPASGLNLVVYILPPLMILAGVYGLYRYLNAAGKRSKTIYAVNESKAARQDEKYLAELEKELKKRDEEK